jgi:hypothetical protein
MTLPAARVLDQLSQARPMGRRVSLQQSRARIARVELSESAQFPKSACHPD